MKILIISFLSVLLTASPGCTTKKSVEASETETPDNGLNHAGEAEVADHTVITLKKQTFNSVVKAGGRILVDTKDIEIITSNSSGIVRFIDHFLFPGVKIAREQQLFTISGDQLTGENTELTFIQVRSDLEEAKTNYERAQKMIADKLITEEHFLSLKNRYEKILNEYNNLKGRFTNGTISISSPDNGYIREVFVTEGQKVSPGEELASMVIEHNLVLKADLSPQYLDVLPSIESANFKVGYSDQLYNTSKMNGRKISYGKSTGENSYYIPVYFRMDYTPELIEGTFAEIYLIGREIKDALVVPNSALMEEYGKLFVYVEDYDGDFLKRYVKTGYNNGEVTQVLEGLDENENIVATGTYQIKLSQMTTTAPAHNH